MIHLRPAAALLADLDRDLEACVRCGRCLAGCPTRRVWPAEAATLRGRIALLAHLRAGPTCPADDPQQVLARVLANCTGCMACQAECHNGVEVGRVLALGNLAVAAAGGGRRPRCTAQNWRFAPPSWRQRGTVAHRGRRALEPVRTRCRLDHATNPQSDPPAAGAHAGPEALAHRTAAAPMARVGLQPRPLHLLVAHHPPMQAGDGPSSPAPGFATCRDLATLFAERWPFPESGISIHEVGDGLDFSMAGDLDGLVAWSRELTRTVTTLPADAWLAAANPGLIEAIDWISRLTTASSRERAALARIVPLPMLMAAPIGPAPGQDGHRVFPLRPSARQLANQVRRGAAPSVVAIIHRPTLRSPATPGNTESDWLHLIRWLFEGAEVAVRRPVGRRAPLQRMRRAMPILVDRLIASRPTLPDAVIVEVDPWDALRPAAPSPR